MLYPTDTSRHTPMTEAEMIAAIRMAVLLEMRVLRWAKWRKNMTLETVVQSLGAEVFATSVAEHLIQSNSVLFRGPPSEDRFVWYGRKAEPKT